MSWRIDDPVARSFSAAPYRSVRHEVDGRSIGIIQPEDTLSISAAKNRIKLIHPPGYDFYGILRSKLFWGRDSRTRSGSDR